MHNLRMKYIDSKKLSETQFKRYTGISWSTFDLMVGEFKHEVRQFEKSYDNQQAEQISLMV